MLHRDMVRWLVERGGEGFEQSPQRGRTEEAADVVSTARVFGEDSFQLARVP